MHKQSFTVKLHESGIDPLISTQAIWRTNEFSIPVTSQRLLLHNAVALSPEMVLRLFGQLMLLLSVLSLKCRVCFPVPSSQPREMFNDGFC